MQRDSAKTLLICSYKWFSCHDLVNDIYSQTAKTVFSHLIIRFSKWCVNEKRKMKFMSVFQSDAKTKNKKQNSNLFQSMSCENEKCKWHLNSIFPCHRKTVGTKVHAFYSCVTKLRETVSMMMKSEMKIVFFYFCSREKQKLKTDQI